MTVGRHEVTALKNPKGQVETAREDADFEQEDADFEQTQGEIVLAFRGAATYCVLAL